MTRSRACVASSRCSSSRAGGSPRRERGDVARQVRRVPPAEPVDRRDRADADAEVVAAAPVAEVVAGTEVAAVVAAAEVGGLVPAIARGREHVDDELEVALHRLRLGGQLVAVRVGEPRPRLRLELVAGEVLRLERQGLREIGVEVGGALARDAVDQVERDVVETGITKRRERRAGRRPAWPAVRAPRAGRGWKLCAPSETRLTPCSRRSARELRRDRLRVRLDRQLLRPAAPRAGARARAGSVNVGVPPPRKIVSSAGARQVALEFELREQRVDVRRRAGRRRPTAVTKSQ